MRYVAILIVLGTLGVAAGCGGSSKSSAPPTASAPTTTATQSTSSTPSTTAQTSTSPGALQAEANAAAAGDIPDNQIFLTFQNSSAGYSMKYPEGWAQQGSGNEVTFRDKNNIVRIVVRSAAPPSRAQVQHDVTSLKGAHAVKPPAQLVLGGSRAWKVTYQTQSAPNPVTGKRVTLVIDRYYLAHGGKEAVVDLAAPQGVDNVDAYRMMIQSVKWK